MRVNVETRAIRMAKILGDLLGLSKYDALGRLIHLWEASQDQELIEANGSFICVWFDENNDLAGEPILESLEKVQFIEPIDGTNYRISGNVHQVKKLISLRGNASEAGKKSGASRRKKRDLKMNQMVKPDGSHKNEANGLTMKGGFVEANAMQCNSIQSNAMQSNTTQKEKKKISPDGSPDPVGQAWNRSCGNLSKIKNPAKLSATRKRHAKARWIENPDPKYWDAVVQRMASSDFCNGKNSTGWIADFNFLIKPDTHEKVMEGKYDNRSARNQADRATDNLQNLWDGVQREKESE